MLIILLCFAAGIGIGFALRSRRRLADQAGRLTSAAVCLLLFLLGLSIGVNDALVDNLGTLGLEALALMAGAVSGRIAITHLIFRRFYRENASHRDTPQ